MALLGVDNEIAVYSVGERQEKRAGSKAIGQTVMWLVCRLIWMER